MFHLVSTVFLIWLTIKVRERRNTMDMIYLRKQAPSKYIVKFETQWVFVKSAMTLVDNEYLFQFGPPRWLLSKNFPEKVKIIKYF